MCDSRDASLKNLRQFCQFKAIRRRMVLEQRAVKSNFNPDFNYL